MNIALMSHDHKKELMVQFCIAYCGILSKHTICATNTTGKLVAEATGLPVSLFLSHEHGGSQQIGARIAYNEIDMKKHSGIIAEFRRLYIKTGTFSNELSKIISVLFDVRTESDYDDFFIISKEDVAEQVRNAQFFLDRIKEYLMTK